MNTICISVAVCMLTLYPALAVSDSGGGNQPPRDAAKSVLESIRPGQAVTAKQVRDVVRIIQQPEAEVELPVLQSVSQAIVNSVASSHTNAIRTAELDEIRAAADSFYESVLARTENPLVRARFLKDYGQLLSRMGDTLAAIKQTNKALVEVTQLRADIDRVWLSLLLSAAHNHRLSGDNQSAESNYLLAMSYPWYQIQNSKALQDARDLYVQAVLGLIQLRQGNLSALQEIVVVPAAAKYVESRLSAAIQAAENKEEHKESNRPSTSD